MSTVTTTRGVLGTKLGMTQVWDANNRFIPVTVVQVAPNVVTQIRTMEKDGYEAVQVASGQAFLAHHVIQTQAEQPAELGDPA